MWLWSLIVIGQHRWCICHLSLNLLNWLNHLFIIWIQDVVNWIVAPLNSLCCLKRRLNLIFWSKVSCPGVWLMSCHLLIHIEISLAILILDLTEYETLLLLSCTHCKMIASVIIAHDSCRLWWSSHRLIMRRTDADQVVIASDGLVVWWCHGF